MAPPRRETHQPVSAALAAAPAHRRAASQCSSRRFGAGAAGLGLEIHRNHLGLLHALRVLLPLLLPVVQGRHSHLGVFRVGVVHGFGVVPQGLLREALGVAALERTFSPRIAVGMERHAFDLQSHAALLELRGTVASAHGAQVREQRAGLRAAFQNGFNLIAKTDQGGLDSNAGLQLLAAVGDGVGIPVHVLGGEAGRIGLRGAGVPEQLVEVVALWV